MANFFDFVALILTVAVCGGVVYGVVFVVNQISSGVQSTKDALKEKGLHVSDKGVSVKTSKRFDREDYVDATQRGFVKVMEASSVGAKQTPLLAPVLRKTSSSSASSTEKKSGGFLRKTLSHKSSGGN